MASKDYTQNYEYACALIEDYLNREELIDQTPNKDNVYGENSIIMWAFTTDFSILTNKQVRKEIEAKLTRFNADEARQYQMALTRLKTTYVDMCTALGMDFVNELRENVCLAHNSLVTSSSKKTTVFKDFFDQWPFLIMSVIGKKVYIKKMWLHQRAQTKRTPNKGPSA